MDTEIVNLREKFPPNPPVKIGNKIREFWDNWKGKSNPDGSPGLIRTRVYSEDVKEVVDTRYLPYHYIKVDDES